MMSGPGAIDVRWLTAFLDFGAEDFQAGTQFWRLATGSGISAFRGSAGQFATLLPRSGDPYVRLQATDDGSRGVHLDVHVDSIPDARTAVEACGASLVADHGHAIMASPAGFRFCLVFDDGAHDIPDPIDTTETHGKVGPHRLDQVCIDVPAALFEREASFWASVTGWELRPGSLKEFAFLVRPLGMPLRILLQRLGPEDPAGTARAHADLACGDHVDVIAAWHEQLGATRIRTERYWTTMLDPGGLEYCLTRRDPVTGLLSP